MCLILEVETPGIARENAGSTSRGLPPTSPFVLYAQRMPKGAKGSRFLLGTGTNQCACGLLAENADTSADQLTLVPTLIPGLELTLRYLQTRSGQCGFSIRGSWHGRPQDVTPAASRRIMSLERLLKEVRAGRIGNNVLHQIEGHAAQPALTGGPRAGRA